AAPTSGGDLGLPQAVGQYVPSSGTLLLARVQGADSTGAGGIPVPAPVGSGPVLLDSVSPVPLSNGAGYAVYEVIDANPGITESVQFPTFVAITSTAAPALAQESVSLAPVSTVTVASTTAPIPRFAPVIPPPDCGSLGDCGAGYFPHLSVDTAPIQLTAVSGASRGSTAANIGVRNTGGGVITWSVTANYSSGSGWLQLNQSTGTGSGSVGVMANPKNLAPGAYQASIVIDAGSLGSQTIPVTLTVQPPSGATAGSSSPTGPVIDTVVNAATFTVTPLVPGSLATLFGSHFAGKVVSVTFNGSSAQVLYAGDTQINVQVPAELGTQGAATISVTVDGSSSSPQTVTLAPAWPAIFAHGVLNQDNTGNAASAPAKAGTVLQIFATGIPDNATVSAQIGGQMNLVPLYAGPAPGIPGVQQVNVAVPDGLAPGNTPLVICAAPNGRSACSTAYTISTN
ncbi:MAG TPA: IPT/TIG domain-containing protein, partial [Bryobacteraceae bacterium]|nr:IPT/TIG domain-containing protein [Bryobacteraceae bacterium]